MTTIQIPSGVTVTRHGGITVDLRHLDATVLEYLRHQPISPLCGSGVYCRGATTQVDNLRWDGPILRTAITVLEHDLRLLYAFAAKEHEQEARRTSADIVGIVHPAGCTWYAAGTAIAASALGRCLLEITRHSDVVRISTELFQELQGNIHQSRASETVAFCLGPSIVRAHRWTEADLIQYRDESAAEFRERFFDPRLTDEENALYDNLRKHDYNPAQARRGAKLLVA